MRAANDFWTSKTTWTGIATVVGAVAGYAAGQLDLPAAANLLVVGLAMIFVRDAIAKTNGKATTMWTTTGAASRGAPVEVVPDNETGPVGAD